MLKLWIPIVATVAALLPTALIVFAPATRNEGWKFIAITVAVLLVVGNAFIYKRFMQRWCSCPNCHRIQSLDVRQVYCPYCGTTVGDNTER